MLSVNRYRIRHRAHTGQGTAKLLDRLLQKPDDWLGANLVILAAASVFASAIATLLAQRSGSRYAVPATSAALTVIVIVFCELAPKIYAATHPEWVALRSCSSRARSCGSRTSWRMACCAYSASSRRHAAARI